MDSYICAIKSTSAYEHGGYVAVLILGLFIAAVTLLVGEILCRIAKRTYYKATDGEYVGSIVTRFIRITVWIIGISVLLKSCLGYNTAVIWGALGVGGIAISLGAQNTISNLLGGLQISFSKSISLGQWIEVGTARGTVKDIRWMSTVLEDDLNNIYRVPNSVMNSNAVACMPDFMLVVLPLSMSSAGNTKLVSEDLSKAIDAALAQAGMSYQGKRTVCRVGGICAEGIKLKLLVYSKWDFSTSAVSDVALSAAASYLQSKNLMPVVTGPLS